MKVNLEEIGVIVSFLLSKLKASAGNELEITADFYWDISVDEIFDPYNEPKNFSLGQLTDDLQEVQKIIQVDNAISYDLGRIANIIKAISIENRTAF